MTKPISLRANKKKTVVQIVRAPLGGIRKHIAAIVHGLEDSDDFDWYWVTSTAPEDVDQGFLQLLADLHGKSPRIVSLKINDRPEFRDLKNLFRIYKTFKQKNVAIFHGHGAKGGLYARVVGRLLGAKTVYTPHGGSLHDMFGKLKGLLYTVVEKALYPLSDLIVVESTYTLKQFKKKVTKRPGKVILNRNGVDIPKQQPLMTHRSERPWVLASFGALRFIKGHDLVIKALEVLERDGVSCEYHIYGEGEEKQNLLTLAEALGVSHRLKIFEKTKDVYGAMAQSDVILQPSRHESFGYVPLEAMAIGRPVISSGQGGLKEVLEKDVTGLQVDVLTGEAFAMEVKKLLNDDALRDKLVEQARRSVVSDFSEEKMIDNLLKIYQRLSQ